ncbi:flavin reductase family protein [Haploplasma axanthum]|uniref:Flavin reductase like domain n=1 Tax=Haploplasma axanthum TaxID=29552 RepID=A0A449BDN0_HAPAX|nr:flavin reductase family protein [Haploplasma axanthum]VEU80527.1 Flavin reductase like domain [Haploplasma axanthum]
MSLIKPNQLTEKENYKILSGTIIPRPIAFVTTINENETINGAPFSFFNVVSANPPLISLSILKRDSKSKDTARNIIKNKEFVVNIPSASFFEQINDAALSLEYNKSEVDLVGLTKIQSELIKTPGIKEALVRFEVVLEQHLEINESADLIIGKIVLYHLDEKIYDGSYIDYKVLDPLGRIAGSNYVKLSNIVTFKRPK